jgi:protein-disulfide isomerase
MNKNQKDQDKYQTENKNYFNTIGGTASFWLGVMMSTFTIGSIILFIFVGFSASGYSFNKNEAQAERNITQEDSTPSVNDNNTNAPDQATSPDDVNGNGIPDSQEPTPNLILGEDEIAKGADDPEFIFVEYGDFSCPVCREFQSITKQLEAKYEDRAQIVFRHYPNTSLHPFAFEEAVASECTREQGKFWEYKDLVFNELWDKKEEMYESGDVVASITETGISLLTENLNLNREQFEACMSSEESQARVTEDFSESIELNVYGTPVYYLVKPDGTQEAFIGFSTLPTIEEEISNLISQ